MPFLIADLLDRLDVELRYQFEERAGAIEFDGQQTRAWHPDHWYTYEEVVQCLGLKVEPATQRPKTKEAAIPQRPEHGDEDTIVSRLNARGLT